MLTLYPRKRQIYATAKNALENGNGAAWTNDNTEVIAFALQNKGYTVGISQLGIKIQSHRLSQKEMKRC